MSEKVPQVSVEQLATGDIPAFENIDRLIRTASDVHGDCEFLRDDHGVSVTFAEFDRRTSDFAQHLRTLGVAKGDRVAVFLENDLQWPIIWASILRIDAVAVPVNCRYQVSDLGFVLRDSETKVLIADEGLRTVVDSAVGSCPSVEQVIYSHEGMELEANDELAPSLADRGSTANFQYTSGTTGFPKGCVLSHGYWLLTGTLAARQFRLRRGDVVLTAQRFSYLDPMWLTVMCLRVGATLVVLDRFSPGKFWTAVREHGVSVFYVLGTMPTLLYKQTPSEDDLRHDVRLILCSGIPVDLHQDLEKRWGVPWREVYGLTETGIDLAVPVEATETVGSGAVGRPVGDKEIGVVDDDGVLVEPGGVGELVVRGEPMMQGYHNRDEATRSAIADGWFHTGDLVRLDENGWVYIVGRIKDMIRRGGENIAAAEVEMVLGLHPLVLSAAVTAVPDEVFEEEVKAHILLTDGATPEEVTARDILMHASHHLARFKVPRFVEFVSEFPMTPSERISKAELLRRKSDQKLGTFEFPR